MKFLSPIQLAFCLILFFLPWIEVQCVPNPAKMKAAGGAKGGMDFGGMPTGPQPLLAQSGLQIATGGYTITNPLLTGEGMGKPKAGGKDDDGPGTAPLLFLFPVAALAGVIVGFVPIGGLGRKGALLACSLIALGAIGVQVAMGFPVSKSIEEDKATAKAGGGNPNRMMDDSMDIKVVWKIPFFLTIALLIGAAGTAFVGGGKPAAKYGRRRREDADDFDRDDDDDDRPRRRDDFDDDDDDRPRRRARRDD